MAGAYATRRAYAILPLAVIVVRIRLKALLSIA
jgi:hypothetical protein